MSHVTNPSCACPLRFFSTSLLVLRHGRSCSEKAPRRPVPSVGQTPRTVAGQTFGVVQDGIHAAGRVSVVVPGDRVQCVGHTKSSM